MTMATKRETRPSGRNADPRRAIALNSQHWRTLRASVLAREPLCRDCHARGIVTEATDVDHADGDPGNNDASNLQPLCHACHSHKTGRERYGLSSVIGCGTDGWPVDKAHHWNEKSRNC